MDGVLGHFGHVLDVGLSSKLYVCMSLGHRPPLALSALWANLLLQWPWHPSG